MWRFLVATLAWSLIGHLAVSSSVTAQEPRPAELREAAQARLRTARVRIEATHDGAERRCLELGVEDLRVKLRGEPVASERVRLVRERVPVLHAVLLDSSGSVSSDLDLIRESSAAYLEQLDVAIDRGLVATFDDDLVLRQHATTDTSALVSAAQAIWPASSSALYDALVQIVRAVPARPGRIAVLLVTDGVDTSSLHDRDDVRNVLAARPDVSVFVVGVNVPSSSGARLAHTRLFLYELAGRTGGRYFDVPPYASELRDVHGRIRELIDGEATLTVVDPDVASERGRLRVRSRTADCRVRVLDDRDPPELDRLDLEHAVDGASPSRIALPPHPTFLDGFTLRRPHQVDPECVPEEDLTALDDEDVLAKVWQATVTEERIDGCALDVVMDIGELYDPWSDSWISRNGFLVLKTRAFRVGLPAIEDLPRDPLEPFVRLADDALRTRDVDVDTAPLKRPPEKHARPLYDWPGVSSGRSWFDLQPHLARAMARRDDYRGWVTKRLRAEAERELDRLRERFRALAPQASEAAIEAAVRLSPDGRDVVARAESPGADDLTRYLAAWLGDVPASTLFERWEIDEIDRLLSEPDVSDAGLEFTSRWVALRRGTFVPSYTRVLTMLAPVYDAEAGRIGYYRILLPNGGWFLQRLKDYAEHHVWAGLPLDLIPDVPIAYAVVEHALASDPWLASELHAAGARAVEVEYEPRTKPRKQNPRVAFRETRIRVTLSSERMIELDWEIDADVSFDPVDGETPTLRFDSLRVLRRPRSRSIRATR